MRQISSDKYKSAAPLFSLPPELLIHALMTLCIGMGCAYPLALAVGLIAPLRLCLLCCAGVTLLFALLDCIPRLRAAAYPLLLAAIFALAASLAPQFSALSAATTLFLNGQSVALAAYSREIVLLLCLLTTGVGASFARSGRAFFPLAALTIFVLLAVSFLGADVPVQALVPLPLALLLSSRLPGVSAPRIALLAALVLLLSAPLLPMAGRTFPELKAFAERVRQGVDDYLFFTEPRTAFSLSSTGYQPLGSRQLGGPAQLTDDPVMQVTTAERTLLRGAIKNRYTGAFWEDATSGRRYLFISPRFAALRRDLFDQNRPTASLRKEMPELQTISVSMLAESASTLYVTQRFLSPTGEDVIAYFSPASELFATRSLTAGSSYAFSGSALTSATQGVRRLVLAAETTEDDYYETIRETYLELPSALDSRIYELTRQITAQAESDFDKAAAICGYLQRSFPYTLNQGVPPEGSDFVSWFLFEEQQGYCTSFASAMAVMARCAGLPSRYIEGYAATPDVDGVARVSQENAHAWVEIYFKGFGWLPFDPTPGEGTSQREPEPIDGSDPNQTDNPNAPDSSDDPSGPDSSQEPTPSPTPTPSPEPTPTPSPDPAATPAPEGMTPSPSPTHTPLPTQTPTPTPAPDVPPEDGEPPLWPWLLLAVVLVAALCALRLYLVSPAYIASRRRQTNDVLLIWYRACEQALACLGLQAAPGEAPASFLWRAHEALGGKPPLTGLGKALCVASYSGHKLKRSQADKARKTYEALLARMSIGQKAKMYFIRLISGV